MIKVYERRLWVIAPSSMRQDPEFFDLLKDTMVDHICGREKFLQVEREVGTTRPRVSCSM